MKEFVLGFKSPFIGIRLILANKDLKRIAIVPLIIDFILFFSVLYVSLFVLMPTLLATFVTGAVGFWSGIAYYGSYALASVVLFIFSGFVTFALAMIISGPFNALLAEKTLMHLRGTLPGAETLADWLRKSFKMFGVALLRSLIVLSVTTVMFFVGIVPGLGVLAVFVSLFLFATDCADYSLEVFGLSLKERLRAYKAHWLGFSGFGAALGLTFLIPGLSFLIMPAAVVGGAHFVKEILNK
ncbi:MAG: EI24 domain-containing protein [Bdellovibrionales bacterium]